MFHSDELDTFKGFKAEWSSAGTETPTIKSAAHGEIFDINVLKSTIAQS